MDDWFDQALCRSPQADTSWWFPPAGRADLMELAMHWCGRCPVKAPCLDAALGEETLGRGVFGVRGGLTANQRRTILRERRAAGK